MKLELRFTYRFDHESVQAIIFNEVRRNVLPAQAYLFQCHRFEGDIATQVERGEDKGYDATATYSMLVDINCVRHRASAEILLIANTDGVFTSHIVGAVTID